MRFVIFAVLMVALVATPVLAQNGKNEDKSNNGQGQSKQEEKQDNSQGNSQGNQDNSNSNSNKDSNSTVEASISPSPKSNSAKKLNTTLRSASGSAQDCDPNFPWKNHGEYVSCVAKSGAGGQAVSEAARSDIGKKSATPSASLSPSPDASGSAFPSAIVSPIPESTESAGLINSITENLASVQERIISIGDQFQALLDIFNPFN